MTCEGKWWHTRVEIFNFNAKVYFQNWIVVILCVDNKVVQYSTYTITAMMLNAPAIVSS